MGSQHDPDYTHTFADRHPQFVLEDVRVPCRRVLGGVGEADGLTNEWFVEERIHIGARCSGAMERLLALAVEWATERVQFGERIYDFQGVSFPLADSAADASAARLLTREAAWLADSGADPKVVHAKASLAKLFASEAAFRCADRVVQVFGGRGYMREYPAERFLRELRVDRIWEGTSEIQRLIIARALEKRGVDRVVGCMADFRATIRPAGQMAPPACPARYRPPALFAPRSIAIVGASPRSGIAQTVRDNVGVMGGDTPVRFVNPRYPEIDGTPTFASLADLPEPAGQVILAVNPLRAARFAGRRPPPVRPRRHPGRRRRRGWRGSRPDDNARPRLGQRPGWPSLGPIAWAGSTGRPAARTYIGDVPPFIRRGHVAGSPSRATSPSVHPPRARGSAGAHRDLSARRPCSTCATTWPTASTTPGPRPCPLRRGLQAARAVPRAGRPRARLGSRSWR